MTDEPKNIEQKQSDKPPKKVKILVTAFQPFDDAINITEYVLKNLSIKNPNIEIVPVVLSTTSYGKIKDELSGAIQKEKPDFVLMMGEANDRNHNAVPRIWSEKDCVITSTVLDREKKKSEEYYSPLPETQRYDTYNSNFLNESAKKFCKDNNIEFAISGVDQAQSRMQCNFATFVALEQMEKIGKGNNVMFIHLNDVIHERIAAYKQENPNRKYADKLEEIEKPSTANLSYTAKYIEFMNGLVENIYTEKTQFKSLKFELPLNNVNNNQSLQKPTSPEAPLIRQ